jgi:hypothetical protein
MAITDSDFQKIWASTSPLTPYEFSDVNYKQGWNFIGSTPPARQMWDFLQKQNDEKTQWLYSNKLSLSGGTMTGSIVNNTGTGGIILGESGNTGNVSMSGGETLGSADGAKLDLFGASHAINPGEAILQAGDGNGYKQLRCKPNGEITWGGNNVLTDGFVGNIVSNSAEDKSVSASTSVTVTTVSLPKGVWVVTGHVVFDGVSGRNYGATVTDSQYFTYGYDGSVSVAPGSNQAIALQPVRIFNLSKTTTIYLNVYTVGGTTIAKNNILTAVRIA